MRASRWLTAVGLVVGITTVLEAQPPQQRQQRGQRQPGQRQPGFGQQSLVTTAVLSNKDLQADLKISDEQKNKLKAVAEKEQAISKKMREAFTGGKGKIDREKLQEIQKERTQIQEEIKKVVDETLTSNQKKRVKQIEVQAQGLRAFTSEANAKTLNLNDSQKTKIKAIADEAQKGTLEARREIGFGAGERPTPEKIAEVNKKVQKIEKQAIADITDALTPEQQKLYKEMTGEPFDTSKLRSGFGIRGGFGGRPTPKKD